MEFRLKALTPVWTGCVEGKPDSLHLTGIKGVIRWWYEVLIRGLDCYACDPTSDEHCELKPKELNRDQPLAPQIKKQICPACYMFGCTGWSGKFNLRIKDENGSIKRKQLEANDSFILEFVERKQFEQVERLLLQMTLKLIVDYGAIGGKTTLKPSEYDYKNTKKYKNQETRAKEHHLDYGIIDRYKNEHGNDLSGIPIDKIYDDACKNIVDRYLRNFDKCGMDHDLAFPNLKNFWFVKDGYINRREHNRIVNRRDDNGKYIEPIDFQIFLGGYIPREKVGPENENASKKIFSFHGIKTDAKIEKNESLESNDERISPKIIRCFGYVKKNELVNAVSLIEATAVSLKGKIEKGEEVLNEL